MRGWVHGRFGAARASGIRLGSNDSRDHDLHRESAELSGEVPADGGRILRNQHLNGRTIVEASLAHADDTGNRHEAVGMAGEDLGDGHGRNAIACRRRWGRTAGEEETTEQGTPVDHFPSIVTLSAESTALIGLPMVTVLLPAKSRATGLAAALSVTIREPESPDLLKGPRRPEMTT